MQLLVDFKDVIGDLGIGYSDLAQPTEIIFWSSKLDYFTQIIHSAIEMYMRVIDDSKLNIIMIMVNIHNQMHPHIYISKQKYCIIIGATAQRACTEEYLFPSNIFPIKQSWIESNLCR